MMKDLLKVGAGFNIHGEPFSCKAFGTGHIHGTYLLKSGDRNKPHRYILQYLNINVFKKPEAVQDNIFRILGYLKELPEKDPDFYDLEIVDTHKKKSLFFDSAGNHWRCFKFIEDSYTPEKVDDPEYAFEGGRSYGVFATRLKDYNPRRLHITIPHFMDAEHRTKQLAYAEFTNPGSRLKEAQPELKRLKNLAEISKRFTRISSALPDRVVHNDAKISNVLFKNGTKRGICVIDLDTVMPGTLLTDFGDMVRSFTSSGEEDQVDPGSFNCREDLFEGLASGYLEGVSSFISEVERMNLLLGAKAVIYMQTVRFLTDYLNGDVYYKTAYPKHNLDRTRNQLGLLESLLEKEVLLQEILNRSLK